MIAKVNIICRIIDEELLKNNTKFALANAIPLFNVLKKMILVY